MNRTIATSAHANANTISGSIPEEEWATRIAAAWQSSVTSIIQTCQLLAGAKADMTAFSWVPFVRGLPFGMRTAQMLLRIAANPVLCDPNHGSRLPPSWRTLAEISKWEPSEIRHALNLECAVEDLRTDLWITPQSSRKEIEKLRSLVRRRLRSGSAQEVRPRTRASKSTPFFVVMRKTLTAQQIEVLDALPTETKQIVIARIGALVAELSGVEDAA